MLEKLLEISKKKKILMILILLLTLLVLRSHSFFNPYYDRDEQSTIVETAFAIDSGEKYLRSYGDVFYNIYYVPLKIFGKYNWQIMRLIALIFVLLTSYAIYLTVKRLKNHNAAFYAAFFYCFFTSTFIKDFFILSAENVFNLFIAYSFLLIVYAEFPKPGKKVNTLQKLGVMFISMFIAMGAFCTKMHGKLFMLFFPIYVGLYLTKTKKSRIIFGISSAIGVLLVFLIDSIFLKSQIFAAVAHAVSNAFKYIFSIKVNVLTVLIKLVGTAALLTLSGLTIWILITKYIFNKATEDNEKKVKQIILIFFFISFIPAFLTLRFYRHYFIQGLLPGCMMAGMFIEKITNGNLAKHKIRKFVNRSLYVFAAISLIFHFTLLTITKANPNFPFTLNFYVPNTKLRGMINWIKKNSKPTDKIYIWGDAPEAYFFAQRTVAGQSLWAKVSASKFFKIAKKANYDENIEQYKKQLEKYKRTVLTFERFKLQYFIDTEPVKYSGFKYKLKGVPPLWEYIKSKFSLIYKTKEGIHIYKRNDGVTVNR